MSASTERPSLRGVDRSRPAGVRCEVAISSGFFFCGWNLSVDGLLRGPRRDPYLLIDQKLVVSLLVLVREVFLDLPQITPLLKKLSVYA